VNERDSSLFVFGGYQVAWHVDSGRFRAWGGGRRSEVGLTLGVRQRFGRSDREKMVGERAMSGRLALGVGTQWAFFSTSVPSTDKNVESSVVDDAITYGRC
jgi:hypothetical protein